jgi:hypothetical protein
MTLEDIPGKCKLRKSKKTSWEEIKNLVKNSLKENS